MEFSLKFNLILNNFFRHQCEVLKLYLDQDISIYIPILKYEKIIHPNTMF